jgi:hypothetical protein
VNLSQLSLRRLRNAIQKCEVSFPSQVPMFPCQSRPDIQWRVAELYFVHNWSCGDLGERYGVTMERARQLIAQWARRAVVLGYLQEIPTAGSLSVDIPPRHPEKQRHPSVRVVGVKLPPPQVHTAVHGQ